VAESVREITLVIFKFWIIKVFWIVKKEPRYKPPTYSYLFG